MIDPISFFYPFLDCSWQEQNVGQIRILIIILHGELQEVLLSLMHVEWLEEL